MGKVTDQLANCSLRIEGRVLDVKQTYRAGRW